MASKRKSKKQQRALGQNVDDEELREAALTVFGDDADLSFTDPSHSATDSGISSIDSCTEAEQEDKITDFSQEPESTRKPAWCDEDDKEIKVSDAIATYTKARGKRGFRETSDEVYEDTLRKKFSLMTGGTPLWADLDRELEDSDDDDNDMTKHTGNYLLDRNLITDLPKTQLEFKKLKDLNSTSYSEGKIIKSVEFNPGLNSIQVALVAGSSGSCQGAASLFQVDGKHNHKIHTVKFEKFPIKCAQFFADGHKFAVGSNLYGHFFVHDILASKTLKIPWNKSEDRRNMKSFMMSPDGSLLIVIGLGGQLHLLDTKTLSVVDTLKAPCQVNSITFNKDGSRMFTHGDGGEVFMWDMNARMCLHKFYDEGCIHGNSISLSPNGRYLACGSSSGIVNIYNTDVLETNSTPIPIKNITNLTTNITSLQFNPTSEILAMASDDKNDALKLVHFPSMKIFKNFPSQQSELKRIQTLNFSPHSGYLSAGNNGGCASLFRLRHFSCY